MKILSRIFASAVVCVASLNVGYAEESYLSDGAADHLIKTTKHLTKFDDLDEWKVVLIGGDDGVDFVMKSVSGPGGSIKIGEVIFQDRGTAGNFPGNPVAINLYHWFKNNLESAVLNGTPQEIALRTRQYGALLRSDKITFEIDCWNAGGPSDLYFYIQHKQNRVIDRSTANTRKICSSASGKSGGFVFQIRRIEGEEFLRIVKED